MILDNARDFGLLTLPGKVVKGEECQTIERSRSFISLETINQTMF